MLSVRFDLGMYAGLIIAFCSSLSGCSQLITQTKQPETLPTPVVAHKEPTPAPTKPFPSDTFYDLLVAEVAIHHQTYDLALDNYLAQTKITQDPGVAARTVQIAEFLRRDDSAMEAASIWAKNDTNNTEPQIVLGTLLAKAQRPEEAFDIMANLLRQDQGKPNFAAVAASAVNSTKENQQLLLKRFDDLIQEFPQRSEIITGKALLLQELGDLEGAVDEIQDVFDQTNDDLHAVVIEARLKKLLNQPDPFARLSASVQANPDNRNLRLQYARFLADAEEFEEARTQYQLLLSQTPYDTDLILNLAQVNYANGDYDQAKKLLEFLIAIDKRTLEANYILGEIARENDDLSAAMAYYSVLPPSPQLLKAAENLANAYLAKNNLAAGRSFYNDIREKHPQQALAFYLGEADVLMQAQLFDDGLALLSQALVAIPDQPNLLYSRSLFHEKLGNTAQMESDLRKLIAMDPNNYSALNALGYSFSNLSADRYEEAYQLISRALSLRPDDPAILDSMGWIEFRRGNLENALNYLEKAYAAYPDAEVAAHLGEVLWTMNRKKDAMKIWATSQKEKPDSEHLLQTIERLTGKPTAE